MIFSRKYGTSHENTMIVPKGEKAMNYAKTKKIHPFFSRLLTLIQ